VSGGGLPPTIGYLLVNRGFLSISPAVSAIGSPGGAGRREVVFMSTKGPSLDNGQRSWYTFKGTKTF
jgi:hypothetical protein